MGQCSKIVLFKEPFTQTGNSTKKIFDDTYLQLKKADSDHAAGHIDPRNGLVSKGYEEVSAAYWNLIYKDGNQPAKVPSVDGS